VDKNHNFHVLYLDYYLINLSLQGATLKYATTKNGNWEINSLPVYTNAYTISFDVDDNGFLHIAYVTNDKLHYATNQSSQWVDILITEEVIATPRSVALKLDSMNKAHLIYQYNDDLVYASNKTDVWVKDVVDQMSVNAPGDHSSLYVDDNGFAHITYQRYGIKYANNTSGLWVNETVDTNIDQIGVNPSIVLDASGVPHVSYEGCDGCDIYTALIRTLRYAIKGPSGWDIQTVETGENRFLTTSLAVDFGGKPYIVYQADSVVSYFRDLRLATRLQNQWLLTTIDKDQYSNYPLRDKWTGVNSTLKIDENENVHISYRDGPSHAGFVKYASNKTGNWQLADVQGLTDHAQFGVDVQVLAQAIDKLGYAHIIYQSIEPKTYYATNRNGGWEAQIIETQGAPLAENAGISITIDENNSAHAVYYLANGELRYAQNILGTWEIETVANIGEDNFFGWADNKNSLHLDTNGSAHIGFTNEVGDLIYASKNSGRWEKQLIASYEQNDQEGHTWGGKDFVILPGGIAYMVYASFNCIVDKFCIPTGLEYATNTNGNWQIQKIDYEPVPLYGPDFGTPELSYSMVHPSISINNNQIAVSYHVELPEGLVMRAARKIDGIWSTMYPDSTPQPTWWEDTAFNNAFSLSSIANRSDGSFLISYLDLANKSLNLAKSSLASSSRIDIATNLIDYKYDNVESNSSETAEITIKNISSENLTVNDIHLIDYSGIFSTGIKADQDFCLASPLVLPPGEHCVLLLIYEPISPGTHDVAIRIDSDDINNPAIFATFSAVSVNEIDTTQKTENDSGGGGGGLLLLLVLFANILLRWVGIEYSPQNQKVTFTGE